MAERPTATDLRLLRQAIELGYHCPPSDTAFSVGAVVAVDDTVLATGYSRRDEPRQHAEEAALADLDTTDERLARASIYSSLEPCSTRASRPTSCTQHILDAGIPRVVYAWREPSLFVEGRGSELLEQAGVTVIEVPDLAEAVRRANAHLPGVWPAAGDSATSEDTDD